VRYVDGDERRHISSDQHTNQPSVYTLTMRPFTPLTVICCSSVRFEVKMCSMVFGYDELARICKSLRKILYCEARRSGIKLQSQYRMRRETVYSVGGINRVYYGAFTDSEIVHISSSSTPAASTSGRRVSRQTDKHATFDFIATLNHRHHKKCFRCRICWT
jgi:hypothetical protein